MNMKYKFINILKIILIPCIHIFSNMLNSLVTFVKVILFSGFKSNIRKINIGQEKDCFILGNGPSLTADLEYNTENMMNKNVFVVNDFVLTDLFEIIKPSYYVFSDPSYWSKNTYDKMKKVRNEVYESINKKVNWPLCILIPYEAYKTKIFQDNFERNLNIKIVYYNTVFTDGGNFFIHFLFTHNLAIPRIQNVLVAAIFNSLNLGFKNVYILGADHSWTKDIIVNSKNEVCLSVKHFYIQESDSPDVWLKFNGEPYKMHEVLQDLSKMFKGYYDLKLYSRYLNTNIFNLTTNSFIDAFDRNVQINK